MSQSVNNIDLESNIVNEEGGGGESTNLIKTDQNVLDETPSEDMSVCLESGNLLASSINSSTTTTNETPECNNSESKTEVVNNNQSVIQSNNNGDKIKPQQQQQPQQTKSITKLIVTTTNHQQQCGTSGQNQQQTATVLQKVVNSPLITVLNPTGPLTVVKTLCVTSSITSTPQFTLVNTSGPLNVTNAIGKSPTITLLNAPVTVVKAITQQQQQQNVEKSVSDIVTSNVVSVNNLTTTITAQQQQTVTVSTVENRGHNVFVKNTTNTQQNNTAADAETTIQQQSDNMPQSHKLLTANNFPTTLPKPPPANGQRNKLKILSNVVVPGTSQQQNNVILNKTNNTTQQRYVTPRQKVFNANCTINTTTTTTTPTSSAKFVQPSNNIIKNIPLKQVQDKSPTRMVYPQHKSQIKTISPVNNYVQKSHGIKTLSPNQRHVPPGGKIQRNTSGLRTIPPQRPQKLPNKPNYIGKHAIQAQKIRQTNRLNKNMKLTQQNQQQNYNNYNANVNLMQEKQLTFNQALTAEIIETLSCNKTNSYGGNTSSGKHFEIVPQTRYESAYSYHDKQMEQQSTEEKSKSGLDTLSLICQAVLLDHNYNATLPPDSPRSTSMNNAQSQVNGISSSSSLYSPPGNGVGSVKRRQMPPLNALSTTSNLSNISSTSSILNQQSSPLILPTNNAQILQQTQQQQPSNYPQLPLQQQQQDDDAASDISDLSERKHDTEGEETDTAPEAEAVSNNEEAFGDYETRCICGYIHDDGYMVECDRCKVWQHVQCVSNNRPLPEEYLCEVCNPTKPFDRHKARLIQQHWLRDRQFVNPKLNRKDGKVKDVFGKHKDNISDSDSSDNEHVHNNNVVVKGRGISNRRKTDLHGKQRQQRRDSAKDSTTSQPVQQQQQQQRRQKRRERKVVKRKSKVQQQHNQQKLNNNSDDENNHDLWSSRLPQLHQWIEKYEEAVTNHYSPELRARISSIRVNGAHTDVTIQQYDSTVNKCRIHTQPLTEIKYLVSTVSLPPNTPVIELRGKYMLSQQHRNNANGSNCGGGSSNNNTSTLSTRQNTQRPGPFLFFYRLQKDNTEVCVDTRTYGNSARFIRRSCKPTAELRHCIEKGVLHLYIVTITQVDKNCELTIKHESHDLAAIGTTQIACACGNPEECTVNKSTIKKNGEAVEVHRKRRGRRTASVSVTESSNTCQLVTTKIKEESQLPPPPPITQTVPESIVSPVKQEIKTEPLQEIKTEPIEDEKDVEIKPKIEKIVEKIEQQTSEDDVKIKKEDEDKSPSTTPIATRRSSQYKSDREDTSDCGGTVKEEKSKCSKKLSREERKLEAILRAIEQMEKADQRKQEHQAKQAHRRESEPNPIQKDDMEPKMKRRRRKGRARTSSTNTSQTQSSNNRRNRLNSTDSCITSGDETLLSPTNDSNQSTSRSYNSRNEQNDKTAVGLLLALSNGGGGGGGGDLQCNKDDNNKSPTRDLDSNSNSAHSSPETHLSSACLLVQAAVEPLESGFKFPKTKKVLMNEWLNKVPDIQTNQTTVTTASSISPSSLQPHITNNDYDTNLYSPAKNLAALAQAASFCDAVGGSGSGQTAGNGGTNVQPRGNAKKRWLRQAISEDHCDSPVSRPDSPPVSEMVAPPKKRRLPRESLSNETSPPTTPTSCVAPTTILTNKQDVCDGDSIDNESDIKTEYSQNLMPSSITPPITTGTLLLPTSTIEQQQQQPPRQSTPPILPPPSLSTTSSQQPQQQQQQQQQPLCLMDPRLMRDHTFNNCDHLVGTVEKTLCLLGFEERRPETITPTKRKLSITEYRQRKKLNNSDKIEEPEPEPEATSTEENNSSESFKVTTRARSGSTSSSTSLSTTDDEDLPTLDLPGKAPAFNSEPTELERQREISSLRLKKAFGLPIDDINKKPTLDVEAILNCELEPKVKPIALPSPTFPIPGSCEVTRDIPSPPLTFKPNSPPEASLAPQQQQTLVVPSSQSNSPIIQEQIDDDDCVNNSILSNNDEQDDEDNNEIVVDENSSAGVVVNNEKDTIIDEGIVVVAPKSPLNTNDHSDSNNSNSDTNIINEPQIKPNMFYTPDEEEDEHIDNIFEETESISYVPPFNNPVYPNSNFTTYTSAIDDDTRYEGRNPSPPPNLDPSNFIVDDQET